MRAADEPSVSSDWPMLDFERDEATIATLHLWLQIVGKVRLTLSPWLNHSWHVPLYLSARGLTTSVMPYGARTLEIQFDFVAHRLAVETEDGRREVVALEPQSVATFYERVMAALESLDMPVSIHRIPSEIADAIPFDEDTTHASYDPDCANRLWRALLQIDRVFKQFRAQFVGKASPVHVFWGSLDIAVTRFSGRTAPPHPGGVPNFPDWVAREAYSHEVSSAGFWPGTGLGFAAFYSYAYPAPDGFDSATVAPTEASWNAGLGEFVLPYEAVRSAASPDRALLDFLESTYAAAADLGKWDREALERQSPFGPETD